MRIKKQPTDASGKIKFPTRRLFVPAQTFTKEEFSSAFIFEVGKCTPIRTADELEQLRQISIAYLSGLIRYGSVIMEIAHPAKMRYLAGKELPHFLCSKPCGFFDFAPGKKCDISGCCESVLFPTAKKSRKK